MTAADATTTLQLQHSVKAATEYVILMQNRNSEGWQVMSSSEAARDAGTAVREWAEGTEAPDGATFVAVPTRHWKPRRVKAETVTTLTIEDAT